MASRCWGFRNAMSSVWGNLDLLEKGPAIAGPISTCLLFRQCVSFSVNVLLRVFLRRFQSPGVDLGLAACIVGFFNGQSSNADSFYVQLVPGLSQTDSELPKFSVLSWERIGEPIKPCPYLGYTRSRCLGRGGDQPLKMAVQHIDGGLVLASTGYDQIRLLLGRFDEFKIHRTDGLLVLRQDGIQRPPSLLRVSSQSSG